MRAARKIATAVAVPLLALVTAAGLTACGDDDPAASSETTAPATPLAATGGEVSVTGAMGKQPEVSMPKPFAVEKTTVDVDTEGSGATLAEGDLVRAQYVGLVGTSGETFQSSWASGQVPVFTLAQGQLVEGFRTGLIGQRVGSRVTIAIPPGDGYGPDGNPQIGVTGADTMVFVVDILDKVTPLKAITGDQEATRDGLPGITMAKGQPDSLSFAGVKDPKKATSQTVVHGDDDAAVVAEDSTLEVRYLAGSLTSKKVFESGFPDQVSQLQMDAGLPAGLKEQLVGAHMGDRVIAVLPKALAGAAQLPDGVGENDTVVMVIDILGVI